MLELNETPNQASFGELGDLAVFKNHIVDLAKGDGWIIS